MRDGLLVDVTQTADDEVGLTFMQSQNFLSFAICVWSAEALDYHATVGELDRPFAPLFCEMQKVSSAHGWSMDHHCSRRSRRYQLALEKILLTTRRNSDTRAS